MMVVSGSGGSGGGTCVINGGSRWDHKLTYNNKPPAYKERFELSQIESPDCLNIHFIKIISY
jgi:hypothetical protein